MLVGNVALGDPRQFHTPVDGYDPRPDAEIDDV
jgi:hypothetical protein